MASKLKRAPAPDPYSYENANDDDENEFTDDEEEYENFDPDGGVSNEPSRPPGLNSRAAPPWTSQAGGPPALPPRRVDDVGSQKPSGGSFATNSTSASGRHLPTMPPGNSRPTPTNNAKQLPIASFGDDDVEESYEECVEIAVPARQGRPLPAVPPNVPPPVTVGVQRPMPQPNTRSLEKQFSSDDDSYEVCTDIPAPRQHPSAASTNRGLPPAIPDYHGEEDDDDVEYVQPDDDNKVKKVTNVVNKGRVPPIPVVNRTQNKVNNSVPAPPNRPSAAKPPAVTLIKEMKQAPPVDDIEYETGEFYTPMELSTNDKPSGKKPFAAMNKMATAPPVPDFHGDDENDEDAEYVLPDEDKIGKPAAKVAARGQVPPLPGDIRATQPKVNQSAPALPNRPFCGARPPVGIQKKDMKQTQPPAVCDDSQCESSECYMPMDQSSTDKPPTKMTGFRLPSAAKVDLSADSKNKIKGGLNYGLPAATSGPTDAKAKVFGKPAENNRPLAKGPPTVGNAVKKPETFQPSTSDTAIDANVLVNLKKNLKTVSQSSSPKSDADSTSNKCATAPKTTEAPPVPKTPAKVVPVSQVKKVRQAEAESGSPQISKLTTTKCPAPPSSGVKLQPKKVEECDDVPVASPPAVNGLRGRMSPTVSSGRIDMKPIGHVVPRVQTLDSSAAAAPSRPLPVPPPAEKTDKKESLYGFSWYSGDISRKDAEVKLRAACKDGCFLIRKSAKMDPNNPYAISVFFNNYIYNLHVRLRPDQKFAIGTEKPDELVFCSVPELVNFYKNNTLEVIGDPRRNIASGKVLLLTNDSG